jgi:hypothetical protein
VGARAATVKPSLSETVAAARAILRVSRWERIQARFGNGLASAHCVDCNGMHASARTKFFKRRTLDCSRFVPAFARTLRLLP